MEFDSQGIRTDAPWVLGGEEGKFIHVDGNEVGALDFITLAIPLIFDEDWAPAPVGTRGMVDGFINEQNGDVWLDLFCSGPGGSTKVFAKPNQVRLDPSQARPSDWNVPRRTR